MKRSQQLLRQFNFFFGLKLRGFRYSTLSFAGHARKINNSTYWIGCHTKREWFEAVYVFEFRIDRKHVQPPAGHPPPPPPPQNPPINVSPLDIVIIPLYTVCGKLFSIPLSVTAQIIHGEAPDELVTCGTQIETSFQLLPELLEPKTRRNRLFHQQCCRKMSGRCPSVSTSDGSRGPAANSRT